MKKKMRLTVRGRQTVIVVLTVLGCIFGVTAAMVISTMCSGEKNQSAVLACEKDSTGDTEEQGSNIPVISESMGPQWLFYQSGVDESDGHDSKEYLDRLVNSWTKGKINDNELSEFMSDYFDKKGIRLSSVHVQSNMLCLFPSANELPDYTGMIRKECGLYDFIGVYTYGQTDEEGRLICYYWEAGAR